MTRLARISWRAISWPRVRAAQGRIVRVHPAQSARNLLRRPALCHQGANPVQQHRTALQLDRSAPPARQRRALGTGGIVALAHRVPRHFARHCGGRPIESSGNCPKTQSLIAASVNLIAFVHRQLAVVISHAYTLPNRGVALQSRARPCSPFFSRAASGVPAQCLVNLMSIRFQRVEKSASPVSKVRMQ